MTGSDEEERESIEDQREHSLDLNAINFLSRSIRTRFGRVISLSHRPLDTLMPVISVICSKWCRVTGWIRRLIKTGSS